MEPERVRVRLSGPERRPLRGVLREIGVDLCFGSGRETESGFSIDGILLVSQLESARQTLSAAGATLTVIGPIDARPHPVRTGDRFGRRGALPRGLGSKE